MSISTRQNIFSNSRPVSLYIPPKIPDTIKQLSMIDKTKSYLNSSSSGELHPKASPIDFKPLSNSIRKDEYVDAMVEDLCDWFNFLYRLEDENKMTSSTFFSQLQDGVILNKHASVVQYWAEKYLKSKNTCSRSLPLKIGNQVTKVPKTPPTYVNVDFNKQMNSFHRRDNVSNFIHWCRNFNIPPGLTFETEDLIMLKNQRNVVVCLLEVARIGRLFGMEVPDIIQLEEEIDIEILHQIDYNDVIKHQYEDNSLKDINKNESKEPIKDFSKVTMRKKTIFPKTADSEKYIEDVQADFTDGMEILSVDLYDNISKNMMSQNSVQIDLNDIPEKEFQQNFKTDNSDTDSLNSYGVSYMIPRYKTARPIGRVKIYDCFDRTNLVKEKKYREKCDMRSLDERVREILSECQCSETFPMKRISEGKYQWGDKKTHIFIRILRNHVMVRVGGGWDTLNEFLKKHDHCRKERNDFQKLLSTPTNKNLKPSITCPVDLKNMFQKITPDNKCFQQNGFRNENQISSSHPPNACKRQSMNIDYRKCRNIQKSLPRPITSYQLIHCESTNDILLGFQTSEVEELVVIGSDNKENSSDMNNNQPSQLACVLDNTPVINNQFCKDIKNIAIQSNQKYLSKIPVLKKYFFKK